MSRYRPPAPKSSPLITPQGKRNLEQELRTLSEKTRPEVTQALADAAAEGDRSENAEYIYRKKQLREIDRRIRYLMKRLQVLRCVDQLPADQTKVFFGAEVEVLDESEQIKCYRIVGADEIDTQRGFISIDAPLARALLNKSCEDEVCVRTPVGETWYAIKAIQYQPIEEE